jgi:hypothetical protein
MSMILAIEPDRRQAAELATILKQRLSAELMLVDTTDRAIAAVRTRVPDLVLVPPLLSPQDDAALAAALRDNESISHIQVLTIPLFGAAKPKARGRGGVLSALRRGRSSPAAAEGCDPAVFAEQVASYLEAAPEKRPLNAASHPDGALIRSDSPIAADPFVVPADDVPLNPHQDIPVPELEELNDLLAPMESGGRTAFDSPAAEASFDAVDLWEASGGEQSEVNPLWAGLSPGATLWPSLEAGAPELLEPPAVVDVTHESDATPRGAVPVKLTLVVSNRPAETALPALDAAAETEPANEEIESLIEALSQDMERLKPVRSEPSPKVRTRSSRPKATRRARPRKQADTTPKPLQDESALFDPEQCGFAALLAKLDAITAEDDGAVEPSRKRG